MTRGAANPGRLRHLVGAVIAEQGLWQAGERVAVAVSGGVDSVCLLDLLCETAGWHGGLLEVLTVDHGMRTDGAADADFVEALAAEKGLGCTRADLTLGANASEALCREERYQVFSALSVDRVALGHHADDQAETVLLNLLRGTGIVGLAGMEWQHGAYVRPMLGISRQQLMRWAEWRQLKWREDPTNGDSRVLRNRIRHEVMPLLEELRPGARDGLARSATLAGIDASYLDSLVPEVLGDGWEVAALHEMPLALASRAIRRLAPLAEAAHVAAVLACVGRGSGEVQLPGGQRLVVRRGRLLIR
ncbi:MAG: tRNA lysidine(34) synthetase TilS [Proteobacteria bacterium]|nr:tRNA lysidine(34) synthetase TilS [Pseudomonadota bacterium]